MNDPRPIGLFDSGVGGLSILREVRRQLPAEDVLYLADQAHVPYGPRPLAEVRGYATAITRFLLDQGAKLVVVACNTASAAALHHLRQTFPQVPFVGMEPAVKPAAERTQSGVVGVLATPATFQGELFASVVERFAEGVTVLQETLPGLVERVEAGDLEGPETRAIVARAVEPLLARGADTLVLACTHYPLVIPLIEAVVAGRARVIDPAPAIARQAGRLLDRHGLRAPEGHRGRVTFYSTADAEALAAAARRLLGERGPAHRLTWSEGRLILAAGRREH